MAESPPPLDRPAPDTPGLRPPRQERSRRTLDRIVQAAMELVAEQGVEATSVQEIVDRAGSSVGSFYARFGGKADLVRHLEERVWTDVLERWNEGVADGTWAGAPLPELLEGLVRLLLRIERTDPAGRRALAGRARPAGTEDGAELFRRRIADDVGELLTAHRGEIAHDDPDVAADILLPVLVGAVRELAPRDDDSRVVVELTRLALAYLGASDVERVDSPEQSSMDFFDVWG